MYVAVMLVGMCNHVICRLFFFFQAEDGIRDGHVTGVQTCALPIFDVLFHNARAEREDKKKQDVEDEQETLDDFALILDMDFDEVMGADIVAHTQSVTLQQQQGRYQVFTREFDAVTHPARTVRDDLLREYRREINTLISHQHIQFNLLVERIRQALLDERARDRKSV